MSYMKQKWLEQQQASVEESQEAWEVTTKWAVDTKPPSKDGEQGAPTRTRTRERETDKPTGTRDVEKFLKEQQDALWRSGG